MAEFWDLYDAQRQSLHQTMQRGDPVPVGAHHLVVDIWTVTPDGRFLLTKRAPQKKYPGMWECTGGSALAGESSKEAALRELEEETGLRVEADALELIHTVRVFERFVDTYLLRLSVDPNALKLQESEVSDAKLVTADELCTMFACGKAMPRERFRMYRDLLVAAAEKN